jgi:hypothetical protein
MEKPQMTNALVKISKEWRKMSREEQQQVIDMMEPEKPSLLDRLKNLFRNPPEQEADAMALTMVRAEMKRSQTAAIGAEKDAMIYRRGQIDAYRTALDILERLERK